MIYRVASRIVFLPRTTVQPPRSRRMVPQQIQSASEIYIWGEGYVGRTGVVVSCRVPFGKVWLVFGSDSKDGRIEKRTTRHCSSDRAPVVSKAGPGKRGKSGRG